MRAAHARASASIYASRNAALGVSAGLDGNAVLDLHGLHVSEVRALLPSELSRLSAEGAAAVSVIVGAGYHTRGAPAARLAPAVEELLSELGYGFRRTQPGLLRVAL